MVEIVRLDTLDWRPLSSARFLRLEANIFQPVADLFVPCVVRAASVVPLDAAHLVRSPTGSPTWPVQG
jgi:hypothetical protein